MDITLKNGNMTAVVTTHGAELIELKDERGISYIWNGNPEYWPGRNPILFPIVGNLKNGQIQMDGQTYLMNRHGFARDCEFEVADQGEDYVVFELKSNEETRKLYPRDFVFQVKHFIEDNGFTTAFYVKNTDSKMMPFCVGAHTAFNCPIGGEGSLEDYEIRFDEEETAYNILLNAQGCIAGPADTFMLDHTKHMPLHYDVFAELDTIIFKDLNSKGVSLCHRESNHGIYMDFKGFPMMAFWTKGKERAPYVCIEPWHGCAALENESGKFEDKEACIHLESGKSIELSYKVTLF